MAETHLRPSAVSQVRAAIRGRITEKVIATPEAIPDYTITDVGQWDDFVRQSIGDAGMAPFHYERNHEQVPEPWRFYMLQHQACRHLAHALPQWVDDLKPSSNLPGLLRGCGCLVLVTWIPLSAKAAGGAADWTAEKRSRVDREHLAATAAAVQNLLLLLTAGGLGTYWSSGEPLGNSNAFDRLGIDSAELLAAAVFVEYPSANRDSLVRIPGKNRPRRTEMGRWFRRLEPAS